jgi:hypothetical protein
MTKMMLAAGIAAVGLVAMAASGCSTPAGTGSSSSASPSPVSSPLPKGVLAEIMALGGPDGVGIGFGSVWVTSNEGTVLYRIDPTSDTVIAKIDVGHTMCGEPGFGFGRVWGTRLRQRPARAGGSEPATNRPVRAIAENGGQGVAVGAGSVWAGERIDPRTPREQPLHDSGPRFFNIVFGTGQSGRLTPCAASCPGSTRRPVRSPQPSRPASPVSPATTWRSPPGNCGFTPQAAGPAPGDQAGNEIWRIDPRTTPSPSPGLR